jgi:hypothetical protein
VLRIEIAKQPDGAAHMRCTRDDGSLTWQGHTKHAAHFVHHDLTHYAVETTLGYRRGFFGLLDEGWDVDDTTGKGSRGSLPPEALEVERFVGVFDTERMSGTLWTLDELNAYAPRPLTQEQLFEVRKLRGTLFRQWSEVEPRKALELQFPAQ